MMFLLGILFVFGNPALRVLTILGSLLPGFGIEAWLALIQVLVRLRLSLLLSHVPDFERPGSEAACQTWERARHGMSSWRCRLAKTDWSNRPALRTLHG
jgi:hypothetical protein